MFYQQNTNQSIKNQPFKYLDVPTVLTNTIIQMAVKFYLSKKLDRNGEAPIQVSISLKGVRLQTSVSYSIPPSKWQSSNGRVRKGCTNAKGTSYSKINSDLAEIESSILKLENSDKEPTKELLKSTVNSALKRKKLIIEEGKPVNPYDVLDEFVEIEGTEKQWADNTKRKWTTFKSHLKKFRKNFKFSDVDEAFLSAFVQYETYTLQMRDVSIQKDIKLFKWFLRWAQKKHYPVPDDFKDYLPKFKLIDKTVVFLTQDELKILYNYVIPEEGTEVELINIDGKKYKKKVTLTTCLDRTRDMFCFCAYTGLRYSDMAKLTYADIKDDQLCIHTQKTNDTLVIPLNAKAKAIIAKHEYAGYPGNLVFPVISNQKMNDYIKEIGELCGFNEPVKFTYFQSGSRVEEVHPKYEVLTTHAARRTFVCTALALGIPANVVMKITGHSDYSAMKPYIEIAEEEKKKAMLKFDEAFKM